MDREEGLISITELGLGGGAHIHYRIWTGSVTGFNSLFILVFCSLSIEAINSVQILQILSSSPGFKNVLKMVFKILKMPITFFAGKKYPVYLFHWHPAKSQFEWSRDLDIKHSFRSILTGQYFANFFVQQGEIYKATVFVLFLYL